mmetsp:Transcript_37648/g.100141  ORF Transcript_37648/g.100141 Transcript_37648/m.100141 type:complete len:211 (-) Transcript_37648:75-707(-)
MPLQGSRNTRESGGTATINACKTHATLPHDQRITRGSPHALSELKLGNRSGLGAETLQNLIIVHLVLQKGERFLACVMNAILVWQTRMLPAMTTLLTIVVQHGKLGVVTSVPRTQSLRQSHAASKWCALTPALELSVECVRKTQVRPLRGTRVVTRRARLRILVSVARVAAAEARVRLNIVVQDSEIDVRTRLARTPLQYPSRTESQAQR